MADFKLVDVDLVNVTPYGLFLEVDLEGVDMTNLLEQVDMEEAVEFYGEKLVELVKEQNDLIEKEDE